MIAQDGFESGCKRFYEVIDWNEMTVFMTNAAAIEIAYLKLFYIHHIRVK